MPPPSKNFFVSVGFNSCFQSRGSRPVGFHRYCCSLVRSIFFIRNLFSFCYQPRSLKFALQLNYVLLLARYHIWKAKLEETTPNFAPFLRLVKSRYVLETKAGDTKKWIPFAECL